MKWNAGKNASSQNLKTTENGNKLDNKIFVLQSNETPEQLMLWIKNYDDKINKNVALTLAARLEFSSVLWTKRHKQL